MIVSRTLPAILLLLGATDAASTPLGRDVTDAVRCDRLGAFPGDYTSPEPWVEDAVLKPVALVAACRAALNGPRPHLRHAFQLARGLLAAGATRDGVALLEAAARRGHAAALFLMAELHAEGRGVEQDRLLAYALYQDAFRRGHVAGLDGMIAILEDPKSRLYDPEMAARARALDAEVRRGASAID